MKRTLWYVLIFTVIIFAFTSFFLASKILFVGNITPQERAWIEYHATAVLIKKRRSWPNFDEGIYQKNKSSFEALISMGELVEVQVRQETPGDLFLKLNQSGIENYRFGSSIIGGQWPINRLVVDAEDYKECLDIIKIQKGHATLNPREPDK